MLICIPEEESKIGSKEPENRLNLNYARGLIENLFRETIINKGTAVKDRNSIKLVFTFCVLD
jgi:hypothetical protein